MHTIAYVHLTMKSEKKNNDEKSKEWMKHQNIKWKRKKKHENLKTIYIEDKVCIVRFYALCECKRLADFVYL